MMRGSRRLVVCTVLTGLLTAGAVSASVTAAHADGAGKCTATGTKATCTVTATIASPTKIVAGAQAGTAQNITVNWTATCTLGTQTGATKGGTDAASPNVVTLTLPFTNPDSCAVTATGILDVSGTLTLLVSFAPGASPTSSPSPTAPPPPPPVHLIKGFAGKCVDDKGNSSANRAKIQIWTCNSSDQAQGWSIGNGELVHNGKCLNDQAFGGNGSHVILWTCDGAANELWTHRFNGEFVLSARGGKLCLDDPAFATRNGTPLIVWTCNNGRNQHWSVP